MIAEIVQRSRELQKWSERLQRFRNKLTMA